MLTANSPNHRMMRSIKLYAKPFVLCTLMVAVLLMLPSCVDDRYNLDNISTEVTIGGNEVIIPLGEIETKTLSSMLGDNAEGLVEENGMYVLKFESEGESFAIENVSLPLLSNISPKFEEITFSSPSLPADFIFGRVNSSFVLDYPDLDVAPKFEPINFSAGINVDADLPAGQIIPALGERSFESSGKVPFKATFDMPEQIRSAGKLYFGEAGSYGSLIEIALDFNGLENVNGGGKLNFRVDFPANYLLVDENGNMMGNRIEVKNYDVAAGVDDVVVRAYLHSIDFSQKSIARGAMSIDDEISYDFDYTFEVVAGYCNSSSKPQFHLDIEPEFRDMEIVINDIVIDDTNHTSDVVYTLNGIPESIQSLDYIAFDSAPITMHIEGMSWLQTDALTAESQLPECFIFEPDAHGWLDTSTNKLTAPMRQLEKGVTFNLKAIDCTKCTSEIKSGQMSIRTSIQTHISDLEGGLSFLLSEVLPPAGGVKVNTVIDEAHFYLNLSDSRVEMREQYFDFNLEEDQLPRVEHTIDVPDFLASVERLEVSAPDGGKVKVHLGISHPEGAVFPVDRVYLSLSVNFKQLIHPAEGQKYIEVAPNGDHILRLDHIEWRPNDDPSLDIVEIEIDAIENLPKIVGESGSRQIVINEKFAVTGGVSIDAGTNVNLEAESAKLNFDFSISDAKVSKFYGKVDYQFIPDNLPVIELGDIMDGGLEIENLDINPIIRFNIHNPIDVPFIASLSLKPYDADGQYMPANRIDIEDVLIGGAECTHLVLSTEECAPQFAGNDDVTFVEVDFDKMFVGTLPSKIKIDMSVASDLSKTHVIDLTQSSYEIDYDYSVSIPLEFGHDFDINYDSVVKGLNESFKNIGELPVVSIGEVAVIADFTTTIPIDFILESECLDKDGYPTDVQITFASENMIHGHHPEDSEPEAHSTIVLKLELGEDGDLKRLEDIDGIRMKMHMRNNSHTPSALSPDQTISGKLRLRVRDGITLDLNEMVIEEDVAE